MPPLHYYSNHHILTGCEKEKKKRTIDVLHPLVLVFDLSPFFYFASAVSFEV